jgi:hypothetical protein
MGATSSRGTQQSVLGGWFSGALDAVEQERQAAEAAGREVYENAIRTGQNVQARTRAELISLGRSKLVRDAEQSVHSAAQAVRDRNAWGAAAMQADAFTRSLANTVTLGGADHVAAFGDAIIDGGPLLSAPQRYQANLQDQQARDAYDATHGRASTRRSTRRSPASTNSKSSFARTFQAIRSASSNRATAGSLSARTRLCGGWAGSSASS